MVEPKEKNIELRKPEDKNLTHCPRCSSENIWRIQRNEIEKLVYCLSNKMYAVKKYLCQDCQFTTLLHDSGHHIDRLDNTLKSQKWLPYIVCTNCGATKVVAEEVPPLEAALFKEQTGKTAFKKITCSTCKTSSIVSLQDYQTANSNEI